MKEQLKIWGSLLAVITGVSVLLWITTSRMPFTSIWIGMLFLVGIPIIWDKYGREGLTLKFWGGIAKNGGKITLSIFLYFLIRGYISYLVNFAPFESFVTFRENSGLVSFLGLTPPQVLFESTFMIIVGLTILNAIYNGKKTARVWVGAFLIICFLGQLFAFAVGPRAVKVATSPISSYNMISNIERNGALGGSLKGIWRLLWGGNDAEASSSIQRIQPKPIVTGDRFNILVDRASTSVWYESQTPYNITSPNMEFDVVTLDGRIIPSFKNDQWPVGEPFQILTSTTRQNLEITVL